MSSVRTGTPSVSESCAPRLTSEPMSARISTPMRQFMPRSIVMTFCASSCGSFSSGMSMGMRFVSCALKSLRATSTIEVAVEAPCMATRIVIFSSSSSSSADSTRSAMYSTSVGGTVTR